MKKQIIIIHGGETFARYSDYWNFLNNYKLDREKIAQASLPDWKDALDKELGGAYEIIRPRMPNALNAKYKEWKIWFEKYRPFMKPSLVLLGHSLGGIFLVKYLSENKLRKKIAGVFLVAAPFDDRDRNYSLADFKPKKDLSFIAKQCRRTIFYYSKDDPVVPFSDMAKYREALPDAICRVFKNRGHFNQAGFPEIGRDIKGLGNLPE